MEKEYETKMMIEMELRGFSESTKKQYPSYAKFFIKSAGRPTNELEVEDLKKFTHKLIKEGRLQPRTINARRAAATFFLRYVLDRKIIPGEVPKLKSPRTLPVVMSKEEVKRIFDSLHNPFYKAILMVMYSTGLRSQEVRNLKISDIDSKNMIIHVRQGKGSKDRKAKLSPVCLKYLRIYWSKRRKNNPIKSDCLFIASKNNRGPIGSPLSPTALDYIVKCAAKAAGIKKKISPHIFRHTFATHLLEKGVHVKKIQYLLGHDTIRSTSRYMQITNMKNIDFDLPLDDIVS